MAGLTEALQDTRSGRGRLVMLVGEPGIGKTRITQELASHAQSLGALTLWGRCFEEQGLPPYWPWVQVLRTYVREADPEQLLVEMGEGAANIAEIVPEVHHKLPGLMPFVVPESQEQARFRLFDSVMTFLNEASRTRPLVLLLEDLHWADQPSFLLLEFLAREISESRLMLVGTYRDVDLSRQHPLSELMGQISRESAFRRETLVGLSSSDVGRIVADASGLQPAPELVQAIHAQTEGNPFFVKETVKLLSDRGELVSERVSGSGDLRVPEGVREVIGQRLNRLSEPCQRILAVAAVIGREFEFNLLQSVAEDSTEEQLLEALDEAVGAFVIDELPEALERYQFSHALIHQSLLAELLASRRV
ncbi:MAG: AAA family ATPase, partial [Dehalococcoidia bacterium]